MFGKIKNILLKRKALIIVLAVLAVVGWFFAIYFGIKANRPATISSTECLTSLERVHNYAAILDQSNKLARDKKSLDGLETQIRDTGNGTLLAVWQNVVIGGNKQQDLNDYFDTLIDSINFFSQ